ncbi:MAG TPA: YitT family protein [Thermosynergistes sp.]|nr:YitT family protein [Thermosynergistes sp.]
MRAGMQLKRRLVIIRRLFMHEWQTFVVITIGALCSSVGIISLTMPFRLPDAGVSGLAVLSNYVFGISPAWVIAIGNVGLLLWGWRELSPRFVIWTAYGVALVSGLLKLLEWLPAIPLDDMILVCVSAGVIKGLGGGLVFRAGASLGGTDIIVSVLRKRYGIEVGKYTFYINLIILGLSIGVVGLERAILGLVSIYVNGLVTDNVLRSFDRRKQVFVITKDTQLVCNFITQTLRRGVTILHGEGGYTKQIRPVIFCLLTARQTMELKRFLAQNDPRAFMVISDAAEVVGEGFKRWSAL